MSSHEFYTRIIRICIVMLSAPDRNLLNIIIKRTIHWPIWPLLYLILYINDNYFKYVRSREICWNGLTKINFIFDRFRLRSMQILLIYKKSDFMRLRQATITLLLFFLLIKTIDTWWVETLFHRVNFYILRYDDGDVIQIYILMDRACAAVSVFSSQPASLRSINCISDKRRDRARFFELRFNLEKWAL